MRQRTTAAPKPEKTRMFSTIHVLKNKQHHRISKLTSFYFNGHTYLEIVTLGVKGLKNSEVNLNSNPLMYSLREHLA